MFTAETKILYRTRARAGSGDGIAEVKVGQIFNFDSVTMELSDKEKEFLESCNKKTWTMIPEELSDPTNYQNFIEYVKFL
jgi:hypothetical protein|nr:MAG TPA: hypothetical protein [Caudoviricetes sp.]